VKLIIRELIVAVQIQSGRKIDFEISKKELMSLNEKHN
jgi:hypothetical protein